MTDPRRLRDDPETDGALRAAIEAGRDDLPDDAQLASLAAKLGPLLGPGGGGGGGIDPGATVGAVSSAAKITLGVAAAAMIGGALWWGLADDAPVRAPHRSERGVGTQEPSAPDGPLPEPSVPEGIDVPDTLTEAPAARPRRLEQDPEAELALIRSAQSALASSPARALELAAEHERRFGDGMLAQEREVIAIDALVRSRRGDDARARADRFHARWPRSAHRRRIDVLVPRR